MSDPKARLPMALAAAALAIALVALFKKPEPPQSPPELPGVPAQSEKLKSLLHERLEALNSLREATRIRFERGLADDSEVSRVELGLMRLRIEMAASKEERLKIYDEMLADRKKFEELQTARERAGQRTRADILSAKADRLEIEICMEKERAAK